MKYLGSVGRTPLSKKEYLAYRQLAGSVYTLMSVENDLKGRAGKVKYGWCHFRLAQTMMRKVYKAMWHTIPQAQQKQINAELQNTVTYVSVKRPQDNGESDAFTYMPMAAVCRIADRVMRQECLWCEKCGKAVNRCQLRKDLECTYKWHVERFPDGTCPFAGLTETGSGKRKK